MKLYYWRDHTPTDVAPMIQLYPAQRREPEDILAQAEQEWPDKSRDYALQLQMGDWKGYDSVDLFGDQDGKVTPEGVAEHLRGGKMIGWERHRNWLKSVCNTLDRAGYSLDLVFCDFEAPKLTRGWQYKDREGMTQFDALDVAEIALSSNDKRMPPVQLESLRLDQYNNDQGTQAAQTWNHWIVQQTAKRLKKVYSDTIHSVFGDDCRVAFYDFCSYKFPVLDLKSRFPRPDAAVDGVSCPPLYIKQDEYYRSCRSALDALGSITGEVVPIIPGEHRIGQGNWLVTQQDIETLRRHCARTCKVGVIY